MLDPVFTAACVQMRSGLDRQKNTQRANDLIAQAASQGARFIATPEMTNVVDRKGRRLLENLPDEANLKELADFADIAHGHKVWLLIGSVALRASETRAANRSLLFSPSGELVARYDKIHMFDVDLPGGESWKESKLYQPGEDGVVVDTQGVKVGLSICYDVRFPELYKELAQVGAEVMCVPAAFTEQTGRAHWKTLLTARAIETGSFVIAPGQGGLHEDGRETYGHSMIIGPWGEVLAEKADNDPGIVLAEIDISKAHEARQRIPNLKLEQKFKISILEQ